VGFIALCWFLLRVIPKPSRATYPCQRAAFPVASAFVIWVTSLIGSALFYKKLKRNLKLNKWFYASFFLLMFGLSLIIFSATSPVNDLFAGNSKTTLKPVWDNTQRTKELKTNHINDFDEVAIIRSSEQKAADIDFLEIETMVRDAVELAGGLESIISNGDLVILKPNLVSLPPTATEDYVEVSGLATDWRVTKAVAKLVRERNPEGQIYIVESSAATSTREIFDFYQYTLENIPEVDEIIPLEDSCGNFEDYNDNHLEQVLLDEAIRLYPDEMKPNLSPEYFINKIYNRADVVISIPVLKNHKQATITGGVKNVAIGMTPPNIYGNTDSFFGKWTKIDHSEENLHKWIHDFYLLKPADFVVVDGLQGFDHGPTGLAGLSMEEMQHNMRLIMASAKPLSSDAICGIIMGLDPTYVNYMIYLDNASYNVGTIDTRFIRTKGARIPDIRETFYHDSEITNAALYTDFEPPVFNITSSSVTGNTITINTTSDADLSKLEVQVNTELLDQIYITDFNTIEIQIPDDVESIDSIRIFAYDRFYNEAQVLITNLGIDDPEEIVNLLDQNFPNPFTSTTTFRYKLKESGLVVLYISDLQGRKIETLINEIYPAGEHQYLWNTELSAGTYFYTLETGKERLTKSFIKR